MPGFFKGFKALFKRSSPPEPTPEPEAVPQSPAPIENTNDQRLRLRIPFLPNLYLDFASIQQTCNLTVSLQFHLLVLTQTKFFTDGSATRWFDIFPLRKIWSWPGTHTKAHVQMEHIPDHGFSLLTCYTFTPPPFNNSYPQHILFERWMKWLDEWNFPICPHLHLKTILPLPDERFPGGMWLTTAGEYIHNVTDCSVCMASVVFEQLQTGPGGDDTWSFKINRRFTYHVQEHQDEWRMTATGEAAEDLEWGSCWKDLMQRYGISGGGGEQ